MNGDAPQPRGRADNTKRDQKALEHLQRYAFRHLVDHGLVDMLIGAFAVAIGLMLHADLDYMPAVVFLIGVYAFKSAHERWIEPRAGHVRLRPEHSARIETSQWITLAALIVAVFGLLTLRGLGLIEYGESWRSPVLTGCLALPLALAAHLFRVRRWYIHAALVFAGGAVESWFGWRYGTSWYFGGTLITLIGLILLIKFVRENPVDDGGTHGG